MVRPKSVVVSSLLLVAGIAGGLLLLPTLPASFLAQFALNSYGITLADFQSLRLRSDSALIERVRLEGSGFVIDLSDIRLHFRPGQIVSGELISLEAEQAIVIISPDSSEVAAGRTEDSTSSRDQTDPVTLQQIFASLERLPLQRLEIEDLSLAYEEIQLASAFQLTTNPLRMEGRVENGIYENWHVAYNLASNGPGQIELGSEVFEGDEVRLTGDIALAVNGDSLDMAIDSKLDLQLLSLLQTDSDASQYWQTQTEFLDLKAQLALEDWRNPYLLDSFSLELDTDGSVLELSNSASSSASDTTIASEIILPIRIQYLPTEENLEFAVSAIRGRAHVARSDLSLSLSPTFSNINISCERLMSCRGDLALNVQAEATAGNVYATNNAVLEGTLNLGYRDRTLRILAPELSLALPEIINPAGSSAVDLSLNGLNLVIAEEIRASVYVQSSMLDPGIEGFVFSNPQFYGDLELENGAINAALNLDLAKQLTTSILVRHQIAESSGSAEIDIREYGFSTITPFSNLLSQELVNFDIVGGTVTGNASIKWSRSADDSLALSGPLELQLNSLNGYYEESAFLDLNTDILATLSPSLTINSAGELKASIATVDIGLPLEKMSWNYQFSSSPPVFSVRDFDSQLLGGSVAIPEFDFRSNAESKQMAVVLTELDLETIVGLADYPNVFVDGLISGYLPLSFSDGKLEIEEGLVGALNPGGTIRYSPVSSTPSQNASVQLLNDALSNYQYETMNTQVYYDDSGDLRMEVQLRGLNPDMNEGQPINLNVSITDNIPSLLQSLRAGRDISDRLEQQLNQAN